jgi:branched-chain amino acid transport system permease protein
MIPADALTVLYSGFFLGSLYAVMAMGLSLLWGTVGVLNFSHGAILTLGAYVTWWFLSITNNFIISILIALPIFFIIGVIADRGMMTSLRRKPAALMISSMLATLAFGTVIENFILITFGPRLKQLPLLTNWSYEAFEGYVITGQELLISVVAIGTLLILWFFLRNTKIGMAMRAVSQDLDGATLVGINVNGVYTLTFAISALLAGVAGVLIGSKFFLTPTLGRIPFLIAFVIIIFGGLGSIKGTIVAAYIIGLLESSTLFSLGLFWIYPVEFIVMMILLIIRPTGLFGEWA